MSSEYETYREPRVLLCVTGGVAAYKACEVLRLLQKAGCDVRVAMTQDSLEFVGKVTFEALSGHEVATRLYGFGDSSIPHIMLSEWADLALVCPCTANVMAKAAAGIADDLVSATLLAAGPAKLALAPTMNTHMWENPATQFNLHCLKARGAHLILPVSGRLACGDVGSGKLPAVEDIAAEALDILGDLCKPTSFSAEKDASLAGRHVLVTAGPTQEAIDPVRFIANRSSGKMGYAIARAAHDAGARVTLVSGPVSLDPPGGVDVVSVTSAAQMLDACLSAFEGCNAAILAAAVADYTPAAPAGHKLKKDGSHLDCIELVETVDILATLSARRGRRVVVGFAAETNNLLANARAKLARKGCDMIVANDVSRADSTFGSATDRVTLVTATGDEQLPTLPKDEVARHLVTHVARLLSERDE